MWTSARKPYALRIGAVLATYAVAFSGLVAYADPPARPALGNPGVEASQTMLATPPVSQALEVLVKFKDDRVVKDIIDAFWTHPDAGRAKFDAFKQGRPEMASASLVRVTYSNELVLAFQFKSVTSRQRLVEARDIADKLRMAPDIAYAEPDHRAQIQG